MWEHPDTDMLKEKSKRISAISATTQLVELLDNEEWGREHIRAKLEQGKLPQAGGDDEDEWHGGVQRREDWGRGGTAYDGEADWVEARNKTSRGTLEKGWRATFATQIFSHSQIYIKWAPWFKFEKWSLL